MKVLVTGSSGFVGSHLVKAMIASDCRVLGLDVRHPEVDSTHFSFHECDILDGPRLSEIMQRFSPFCVVHLAARTDLDESVDLIEGYAANITGVENLVNAIGDTESVQTCIYTSSQLVCGLGYTPQNDLDYRPNTLYGKSKVLGEKIVRERDGGGVNWCIVRPTTIWGPGMNAHYQRFFRMVADGRYFHVGQRPLRKSYGYVGNVVHQYSSLLRAKADDIHGKTFYLADYEALSLREWANMLSSQLGSGPIKTVPESLARLVALFGDLINVCGYRGFPLNSFRLNNVMTEYQVDMSDTEKVCGPLPYTLEHGVNATSRWYRTIRST